MGGKRGRTPGADRDGEKLWLINIRHAGTARRQGGRPDKPGQEAEDEDGGDVLGEDARDLEDDEEGEADDVDWVAPPTRDLLHRREEHWPKPVRRDEEGEAARGADQPNVELGHDSGDAGRVDRGADVD